MIHLVFADENVKNAYDKLKDSAGENGYMIA